tara:strand:- start:6 stop:464 length:459 start_codon:yes stop_codon:yes gene_type:complete
MIDTDKYEGHTEGPWAYCEDEVYAEGNPRIVALRAHGTDGELTSKLPHRWADFALIAAAPDLLAEVKRLRKQYTELREALVGDSPNWTQEELIEKVLEIYDKALVFDIIYDFNERMQLQSESYENELWRMDWLLKNPTKEYEDYDKEMNKND